jgi:Tfp pilus assembly protein PilO
MNFNKLPKEKRNQLVLVVMITLMAMAGLGFGLIKFQYQNLAQIAARKAKAQEQHKLVLDTVNHAAQLQAELATLDKALAGAESDMASGDLNWWVINAIRQFKTSAPYHVEIPQFGQIDGPKPVSLFPSFPYKQVTVSISGSGHFHDLGQFIADFENRFSHARVLNLNLDLNNSPAAEDPETLAFKMDLVFLVKNNL